MSTLMNSAGVYPFIVWRRRSRGGSSVPEVPDVYAHRLEPFDNPFNDSGTRCIQHEEGLRFQIQRPLGFGQSRLQVVAKQMDEGHNSFAPLIVR